MVKKKDNDWRKDFDGFFNVDDMDQEFESMKQYMDKILESLMSGEMNGRSMKPFVYGFSMRMGPDGQPHIQKFGDTHYGPSAPKNHTGREDENDVGGREPLTDIIESSGQISITVEIPGVEKGDVNLEVVDDLLVIAVDTAERRYYKEVKMPCIVDQKSAKATYNNGVLDIILKKADKEKKGTKIDVE